MENASKALLMAGSVLLGVLIISIMVYLFSSYSSYSSRMYEKIEDAQIEQFNTQFLKYYGSRMNNSGEKEYILCTPHDIISLANLARQYNEQNETQDALSYGQDIEDFGESISYIQISVEGSIKENNVEKWTEDEQLDFIKNSMHETEIDAYQCIDYKISSVTKRICYMRFELKE